MKRATTFLSQGFEALVAELPMRREKTVGTDFDLIVIGSGYGAAMALHSLAGCEIPMTDGDKRPARVAVLERGSERLPGAFPSRFSDLPGEVRFSGGAAARPRGVGLGLFDLRLGGEMSALVANGLGGGSLINAGVMLEPDPAVFTSGRWPAELAAPNALSRELKEARELLGASIASPAAALSPGTTAGAGAGPEKMERANSIESARRTFAKFDALNRLGSRHGGAKAVPITVQLDDDELTRYPVRVAQCTGCGDCATGCNYNAKLSLDVTVLASAAIRPGVEIYTGVTAIRFHRRPEGGWTIRTTYTQETLRSRLAVPIDLTCDRLVLAAGAYGSTELMLRSEHAKESGLSFSSKLGSGFSGNGDLIAAIADLPFPANGCAVESGAPASRAVGPTITGMVDLRNGADGFVIQELGIPVPLRRLLAETIGLVRVTGALDDPQAAAQTDSDPLCTVDDDLLARSLIFAVIGDDRARGKLTLARETDDEIDRGDGSVSLAWEKGFEPDAGFQARQMDALQAMAADVGGRARAYPNPVWQPLGGAATQITGNRTGPLVTVHPLGGCAMADHAKHGVVDALGRVWVKNGEGEFFADDSLVILDGAIIPGAIGINPALTISALALRAGRRLANAWGWSEPANRSGTASRAAQERPVHRFVLPTDVDPPRRPTQLELIERLTGPAKLSIGGQNEPVQIELTLRTLPFDPRAHMHAGEAKLQLRSTPDNNDGPDPAPGRARPVPALSQLRIFRKADWDRAFDARTQLAARTQEPLEHWLDRQAKILDAPEAYLSQIAMLQAPISGWVGLLRERPRHRWLRAAEGLYAWVRNTAARSAWQSFQEYRLNRGEGPKLSSIFNWRQFPSSLRMTQHAARTRTMEYEITIHPPSTTKWPGLFVGGETIRGRKTLRYAHAANPWRQLMQVRLDPLPHAAGTEPVVLTLDPAFLARVRTPLLAIVDEDNHADGIADLFAYVAHSGRRILLNHLPSFVRPDKPMTRVWPNQPADPAPKSQPANAVPEPARANDLAALDLDGRPASLDDLVGENRHRLPSAIPGLEMLRYRLPIPGCDPGVPDTAVLTRYRDRTKSPTLPPVLLIHGFTASGSTFAHPALTPGLAPFLARAPREVWLLDLRTSGALRSARHSWVFEDQARGDIPCAIEAVCRLTHAERIDVFSHCMGATMFSMAVLDDRGIPARPGLRDKIRRVALSQAGPVMKFRQLNIFRAYLAGLLRYALPLDAFQLRPEQPDALGEQLFDRLLSTLPYPDDSEFDRENPLFLRTPWTQVRHRMDALFGKDFNVSNMSDEVLARIDDQFGLMDANMIGQALWFAKRNRITSAEGEGYLFNRKTFPQLWPFETLWVHSEDSGVFDPGAAVLMQRLFDSCGIGSRCKIDLIAGAGHQDWLIGRPELCLGPFGRVAAHLS